MHDNTHRQGIAPRHGPTNQPPSPAIVAQAAVERLPRWALLALCVVYVLAGFVGRDPWRTEDAAAYALMQAWAHGTVAWSHPDVHISHVLGGVSMQLMDYLGADWDWSRVSPTFAARLPFMGLLGLTLAATWEASYYLARREAAQPVPFAFGGEATPTDYARAIADGALLALLGTLGLARVGHEATDALWQLCMTALLFFALSAWRYHPLRAGCTGLLSALALALQWNQTPWQQLAPAGLAGADFVGLLHLLVWFAYPTWVLGLLALYKWRRHWVCRHPAPHIALPLLLVLVHLLALPWAAKPERFLMSALPAWAALAAFALPTLRRGLKSLIEFSSLMLFGLGAIVIWVVWLSLQTGLPAQPAQNIARLQPSFVHVFSMPLFLLGLMATLAWCKVVMWRLGRHRSAIWISMVAPACGWVLCWTLLSTLWLPLLNHARKGPTLLPAAPLEPSSLVLPKNRL